MDVIREEMARRVACQLAACDLVRAARDLLFAAKRCAQAVQEWDPAGEKECPAILALAETTGGLLAATASSSLGVRALFIEAVAQSEPKPKQEQEHA